MTHKIRNLTRLNELVWAVKESGSVTTSSEEFLAGGSAADSDRSNAVMPESLR